MKKYKNVLVLGSGALKIGEAGEFDYSGSQALKVLREEGIRSILVNPNIATVQTDNDIADKIYFLPVESEFVTKVIEKEKPEGIFLSFGGQTALNCGVKLYQDGILEKYNVDILGTDVKAIIETEDRDKFINKLLEIGIQTPKSIAVGSLKDAEDAAKKLKFPVIIRAAFSLGGLGSGFCTDQTSLKEVANQALSYSQQILIEESLKGWKEIEYEVVRDKYNNCITVCNMENFDPLGIHTGESIVVAPSQTLSNLEYHKLREVSIRVIKHIGIVGECNIQYAVDPNSNEYRVIEVNARLSRSSALASKATGYPLAFVAAKLGLGYGIDEIKNSVTKVTTACFEPALDYIVCKIPKWDLKKFKGVSRSIGSSMKSVGEVMAIGRSFEEAIQKGLRMIEEGMDGFCGNKGKLDFTNIEEELSEPTDMRIFLIDAAFNTGMTIEKICKITRIDKWFLEKLKNVFDFYKYLQKLNTIEELTADIILEAKQKGFSDIQIARAIFKNFQNISIKEELIIRDFRIKNNIVPYINQIDTLAAEFPCETNFLYMTYHSSENDIVIDENKKSVIVLGSGAYKIGSSVEFDWCCVSALKTINKCNLETVMINYNPETVSTDYDISDRLYFEEMSLERILDIIELENNIGVIVSTGGQIPNNLALKLAKRGVNILGTKPDSIDNAENRHRFSNLLDKLKIDQPEWKEFESIDEIYKFLDRVGFPLIIRPSYVLSGAAMNIVSNKDELEYYLQDAAKISNEFPVVVSEFIEEAKEIEFDGVADNGEIVCYAISEHIEFAGVHSGDATIVFPAQKIYIETIRRIKKIARQISSELSISGPFNIQFLAKDNKIKVIECNLRSSRTFPFVSKLISLNFIEIATKIMLKMEYQKPVKSMFEIDYIGIKAPHFSFSRLHKADPVIGVEMASTGEVGCIGDDLYEALLKAMISVGYKIPKRNILLSSGPPKSKVELIESAKILIKNGFNIYATRGTGEFLKLYGINSEILNWPNEDKKPNTIDFIKEKKIDLVINIPKDLSKNELDNDYIIRRTAVNYNIPLITNARLAAAFIQAICEFKKDDLTIKSIDEYE